MKSSRWLFPLAAFAALSIHCSDDETSVDATADVGSDAVADLSVDQTVEEVDTSPRPIVTPSEPEPFSVVRWRITWISDSSNDPVHDALESGSFKMPDVGVDNTGVEWEEFWELGENGVIASVDSGLLYAVAEVYTGDPMSLIIRADTVFRVYLNGSPLPGDVYHSRRLRIPFRTIAGTNQIVVQAFAGRNVPEITFESVPDEVYFNMNDTITPDLLVGDDSEQYVGLPVLNLSGEPAFDVAARIVESETFEATELVYPSLAANAVTQVAFRLVPTAPFEEAETTVTARVHLESLSFDYAYEFDIDLNVISADSHYRRTFRSQVDNSAQYYGVAPPTDFDPEHEYGLVLSLHGAGVQAIGQASAYSRKDWTFIVAPTNRRPFGFDWEAWGRLDGIEVLEHAMESYPIDPERVYVAGHSMGGHGTWQLGVLFPGRFAVVAPSAGWESFQSYTGRPLSSGAFGRAQASSSTINYLSNLANRGVYIIHGSADDNVPVREGRDMATACEGVVDDMVYHEEPGAGHWWDGDASAGADCVDWPPLFDFMYERQLDPYEMDFQFTTPSPWVNAEHSFVTIRSASDPYEDCTVVSQLEGSTVIVTTTNVRSLVVNADPLGDDGVTALIIDGETYDSVEGSIAVGPQDGKRPDVHGPFNQVFHRPFCFAYPDSGTDAYRDYAAFLLSNWSFIGNGHGCALPVSRLTDDIRAENNIIYLGIPLDEIPTENVFPFDWSGGDTIMLGSASHQDSAALFVFPEGERLSAAIFATPGSEYLFYRLQPFTSSFVAPDYLVWADEGATAAGFFDGEWDYEPGL